MRGSSAHREYRLIDLGEATSYGLVTSYRFDSNLNRRDISAMTIGLDTDGSAGMGVVKNGLSGAEEMNEFSTGQVPPKAPNQHLRRNPPIAGEAEAIAAAQTGDAHSFEIL